MMLSLPNTLSLLRLPLALLFLKQNTFIRLAALILALTSDILDGFFARRFKQTSKFGALLDPFTDRFFVFFVMGILLEENQLNWWEAGTLLCRDISVLLFGLYLVLTGKLAGYKFRAIWCGKVTTFMQFVFFFVIVLGFSIPFQFYSIFVALGLFALIEFYYNKKQEEKKSKGIQL